MPWRTTDGKIQFSLLSVWPGIFLSTSAKNKAEECISKVQMYFNICAKAVTVALTKTGMTPVAAMLYDSVFQLHILLHCHSSFPIFLLFQQYYSQTLSALQKQNYNVIKQSLTLLLLLCHWHQLLLSGWSTSLNQTSPLYHPKWAAGKKYYFENRVWMPVFVGIELCSDETFRVTKARYSVATQDIRNSYKSRFESQSVPTMHPWQTFLSVSTLMNDILLIFQC